MKHTNEVKHRAIDGERCALSNGISQTAENKQSARTTTGFDACDERNSSVARVLRSRHHRAGRPHAANPSSVGATRAAGAAAALRTHRRSDGGACGRGQDGQAPKGANREAWRRRHAARVTVLLEAHVERVGAGRRGEGTHDDLVGARLKVGLDLGIEPGARVVILGDDARAIVKL